MSKNIEAVEAYISGRLEEVAVEQDIQVADAWPRVAAQMLGYDVDAIDFFPSRDVGIDFCYRSNRTFEVFQCKMHDVQDAGHLNLKTPFGPDGFTDLQRAAEFLLGTIMPPNVNSRLLSFHEQLREELSLVADVEVDEEVASAISLKFQLITLGDSLTPTARTGHQSLKRRVQELAASRPALAVTTSHLGITDLAEFFESPDTTLRRVDTIRLRIGYDTLKFKKPEQAEIRSGTFVTFYAKATDLVAAARREGPALFDANVRYELASSNINEEIRRTASHPKTMKLFHLYNNGVTIRATGWAYRDNERAVEVRAPAVINGCQTVRTLARVKKELEEGAENSEYALKAFDDTCLVLVRLIQNDVVDSEEIVRAANTQNAMEPRNLLSNRTEQRSLEKEFAEFGWFYERKDGAADALREAGRTSLAVPLSKFQARLERRGPKTLRSCDNREVARRWLSFIGYSDEGKNKRNQHFPHDGKGLYERIFLSAPRVHRDSARLGSSSQVDAEFAPGRPPATWLLYSHHLFELIRHLLPVATKLRARVRREIATAGKEPTLAEINQRLLTNDSTRLAFALSMLDHVVLQLAGFAFARALEQHWLAPAPGRRLLSLGAIGQYQQYAEFPEGLARESLLNLTANQVKEDPALIAIRLAVQAVDSTLCRPEYQSSFLSSERKSRYLQADQLLRAYAEMLNQYETFFATPGNFLNWWSGGSPIKTIRDYCRNE